VGILIREVMIMTMITKGDKYKKFPLLGVNDKPKDDYVLGHESENDTFIKILYKHKNNELKLNGRLHSFYRVKDVDTGRLITLINITMAKTENNKTTTLSDTDNWLLYNMYVVDKKTKITKENTTNENVPDVLRYVTHNGTIDKTFIFTKKNKVLNVSVTPIDEDEFVILLGATLYNKKPFEWMNIQMGEKVDIKPYKYFDSIIELEIQQLGDNYIFYADGDIIHAGKLDNTSIHDILMGIIGTSEDDTDYRIRKGFDNILKRNHNIKFSISRNDVEIMM